MPELTLYCPMKLYHFPGCDMDDFNELDLDDGSMLNEHELKDGHCAWIDSVQSSLLDYLQKACSGPLLDIEAGGDKYAAIRENISDTELRAELCGDRLWMAVCYQLKEPYRRQDAALYKEYAAEQLATNYDIAAQSVIQVDGGLFAFEMAPVDIHRWTNQYDVTENHMLLREELPEPETGRAITPRMQSY